MWTLVLHNKSPEISSAFIPTSPELKQLFQKGSSSFSIRAINLKMALAKITFPLAIFFSIIILYHDSLPVSANEATLVESVCSRTSQPGYCRRCVNSFPIIKKDTARDLAVVAIDCAIYQASVVSKLLNHYIQSTQFPEMAQCGSIYDNLQEDLRQAASSWLSYQYGKASSLLDSAKWKHFSCHNLLVRAKRNSPVDLANEFYTFTAFDDVARNVLSQIM